MQISMSATALGTSRHVLASLDHILALGAAHAAARKIDPLVLTGDRLAPDMFPLRRQVQIACDAVKNGLARIAGVEAPKFEDDETSFDELRARIRKTLAFVDTIPAGRLDGTEDREIVFPVGRDATRSMPGLDYLTRWMLPNLFFHVTTAYNILRHDGVEVGKADYLLGAAARAG
ncbi:MAG: DUF1993 domain-containing protein [Alphaproteobacteria bacterium]|nr:DUF1993 domain-containing protein [Alphaproteobacteria bacterium]